MSGAGVSSGKWTPQQLAAIQSVGGSLLVSAAAGSGKTSVLSERCAYLMCDAPAPHRCNVGQLLVVTFTEAAALEMKGRIEQALRGRLLREPDNEHLRRQINLLDHAQISTLHSFCNRLLRQNFHRLEIDPAFRVMDAEEAHLLRLEVVRDLFAERYDAPDAATFTAFIDAFGDGNDQGLMLRVVQTYELLRSLVDPQAWMKRALQRIDEAVDQPLERSELGREYLAIVKERIGDLLRDAQSAFEALSRLDGFGGYANYAANLLNIAQDWRDALERKGYDALIEQVASAEFGRLPPVREGVLGKEAAKAIIEPLQKSFKDGALKESLRFTTAQWHDGLRSIQPHAKVFHDLIGDFARRYKAEKDESHAIDFADLERYALDLLREGKGDSLRPSPVARLCHNQFRYVLVDEYQDINEVQDAILTLVSRESRLHERNATPNLFCVGDVKQSIYGFRLAEPSRFLNRHARFKAGEDGGSVIDLQANFRSRAPLLNVLNELFSRTMTAAAVGIEYDQSHYLHPQATFPESAKEEPVFAGKPIELHLLPEKLATDDGAANALGEEGELERAEREALVIARRIEEMMGNHGHLRARVAVRQKDGSLATRPIEYRDIVILLRATRYHSDEYADVLRQRGIPVYNAGGSGYFDSTEIRDLLSLLRLLDNAQQDIPLAAVLRSPLAHIANPDDALARIRLAYPVSDAETIAFHAAAHRYAGERSDDLAASLQKFFQFIAELREIARKRPVADLVWAIYERTGYLAFCSGLENGSQRCANLLELHRRAQQFGSFSRQGLYRFIRFLESLRDETEAAQASDIGEAENVVRILSVHKSKGLEFPVVILPGLGKRINFSSASGNIVASRHAYLGMTAVDTRKRIRYPSLASFLVTDRLKREALAEEMRVLYVAMTRAKEHLILIGTTAADRAETWERNWANRSDEKLPASTILLARTMLDWIGPVSAMIASKDPLAFSLYPHPAEEIVEWSQAQASSKPDNSRLAELSRLDPLANPPAETALARKIIARLTHQYPHRAACSRPAAISVSEARHDFTGTESAAEPATKTCERPTGVASLALPAFLTTTAPSALDRGHSTHLFLEHLDFSRCCDQADLREQLEGLVTRQLLSPLDAKSIDLSAVAWLFTMPLGQLLRKHAGELIRELPITLPAPSSVTVDDPRDLPMLRGRIDLLIPDESGFTLIDWKTDQVSKETLAIRLHEYRSQVALYQRAAQTILRRPVHTAYIVFLAARNIEIIQ